MRLRCLWAVAITGGLATAQVPLEQEPRHHLEFANESLRVISPQIPAGDTTLDHIHTHDDATVCIHGSQVRAKQPGRDWSNPGMPCVPGTAGMTEYTGNPRSHTVQNVGPDVYHLLLVENLRDSGWQANDALADPALTVVRENRSFRVYKANLTAPAALAHTHAVPTVVVLVMGKVTAGDKQLDEPGRWALVPAGEKHQISARGEAQWIEIEVR
jgi:hypothetical protein